MAKQKTPEELSLDELRRLLVERRRNVRKERLEHYRRTGRAVRLAPVAPEENRLPAAVVNTPDGDINDTQPTRRASRRRRWFDRILIAIEVMAVIGVIGLVLSALGLLRTLNEEVASALEQPTLTPTPLVMAVVLPSGHVPPDAQGNTRPNDAEIPEHLRPMVQSLANLPVPTPGPEQAIRIQIPAIDVDAPIVQGDGWEQLKKGVAQHLGSANPGQSGNMVLSAHNDVYGEIFRYLDRLQPGDQVVLYTQMRQYTYTITRTEIVEPTQVEVMAPTSDATVTLISCYPYLVNKQRIVVFSKLQN
ncbi:MAG: class D sortase [Anaerolineales bacterium]|nr:class D sortase [Anaerolineales bacterium]